MGWPEWMVVGVVALVVLAAVGRALGRWRSRRMAEIVVEHFVGFLFELARADGPENAAECSCIAEHAIIVAAAAAGHTPRQVDTARLSGIICRAQHAPMTSADKERFLVYVGRSREMARQFFDLFCQLAACDGRMNGAERRWLEAVHMLTLIDPIGPGGVSESRRAEAVR